MSKTIYTASKTVHAPKWRGLREDGFHVDSSWIDEAGPGESKSLTDLWVRCVTEASRADVLLLYVEPGEVLKGALVEVGAALASGVPVYVVGEPGGSWVRHPLVRRAPSVAAAFRAIEAR